MKFDLILYGATGFTGKLVAAYLQEQASAGRGVKWAIAGRSHDKLDAVRKAIGAPDLPIIMAESDDAGAMRNLASSTRLVISTAGPYQLYGSNLVAACAETGTDYVDLCGEPIWMRDMIERYEHIAKANGARILFSCGFDSIPSELGVLLCQREAMRVFGKPAPYVRGRVRAFVGGPSGGSVAARMSMMGIAAQDAQKAALMADPFALTPGFAGPEHADPDAMTNEPDLGMIGPFMLGPTDMKNVHRSNLLMNHAYGADFVYDEKLVNPPPPPPTPPSMDSLPKPGEGPSEEIMANGRFDILFIGEIENGQTVRVAVKGQGDPGYRLTSRMVAETALTLLASEDVAPGIWTPIAALQDRLIQAICDHCSITTQTEA